MTPGATLKFGFEISKLPILGNSFVGWSDVKKNSLLVPVFIRLRWTSATGGFMDNRMVGHGHQETNIFCSSQCSSIKFCERTNLSGTWVFSGRAARSNPGQPGPPDRPENRVGPAFFQGFDHTNVRERA